MTIGPEHPDHPGYQGPPPPRPAPEPSPEQQQWQQYGQQQPGQPYGQQPYGQPPYGQPGYGYGAPYVAPVPLAPMHPQATTALTLGIIGLAGTFMCGVLVVLGPFAWAVGAKAKRQIAASPGQYRGESEANIGMILGIITTVLLALVLLAVALFVTLAVIGSSSTSSDF